MNGFLYTLTLTEPVLANSLGGEPNSAKSLYYIPGGLLRGAAINAYNDLKDAADETFRRLFLDGRSRYLNAYPLAANRRSSPSPLKFRPGKYFDVSDLSIIVNQTIHALDEEWQINVHTQRDAKLGHATTDAGTVYRYIALPAGLRLQGAVLTGSQADAETLEKLLKSKPILMGKARTAGYGHVKIETGPLGDWNEGGRPVASNKFTLTLLSPAIVRDENGQASLDIKTALGAHLGVVPEIKESYRRPEIVGGFNRTWGLPLPQVTAIAAGSIFEIEASVDAETLEKLQETGLGERRAEGFGRVAVNLDLPDEIRDDDWQHAAPEIEKSTPTQTSLGQSETANLMLKRLVRRELDEKIIRAARNITKNYTGTVPNSQLSRWRIIVRDVLGKPDLVRLLKFCEDSKGKSGWKKMEKARIKPNGQTQRLTEWIESLLNEPAVLYSALEIEANHQRSLGPNSFKMDTGLNIEYRLRLLDAVLAILAKKNGGGHE